MISRTSAPRSLRAHALVILLATLAVGVSPSRSRADDGEPGLSERYLAGFSPYVTAGPYTTIQRVRAYIETDFGPSNRTANTLTNLGWMFQLGVQSPRLAETWGKPRLDVSGGLLVPTNNSSVIGSSVAEIVGENRDRTLEETKLQLDYGNSYLARVGVEFLIEELPVDLTVMPGFQYLYLDSRYVGEVGSERSFPGSDLPSITRNSATRVNFVQHLAGPSLRVGTESVEFLGLEFDLFIEGVLLIDLQGTRREKILPVEGNRRASYNWEAGTGTGLVSAGLRIRLP